MSGYQDSFVSLEETEWNDAYFVTPELVTKIIYKPI